MSFLLFLSRPQLKIASFFVLSVALHAGALAYSVAWLEPARESMLPVAIVTLQQDSGGSRAGGAADRRQIPAPQRKAARGQKRAVGSIPPASASPRSVELQSIITRPTFEELATEPLTVTITSTSVSASQRPSDEFDRSGESWATEFSLSWNSNGYDRLTAGGGGHGRGIGAGPLHTAPGAGTGKGSLNDGVIFTQARYSETPKPDYPDTARRQGKEGRVLLRVLVDERGRSKAVEVNHSSGSEALDRAAAETMKRWRFSPARSGDKPVESWVKIPIEFRLTDSGD